MKWTKGLTIYTVLVACLLLLFSYYSYNGKSLMPFTDNVSWQNNQNSTTNGFHHK